MTWTGVKLKLRSLLGRANAPTAESTQADRHISVAKAQGMVILRIGGQVVPLMKKDARKLAGLITKAAL